MRNIVNIEDFGMKPNQNKDACFAVLQALNYCKTVDKPTLYFPKGEYHFWPTLAYEKLYYISNHDDDALKRVAFPILQFNDIVIDGQDSEFIFHGLIIPFVLDSSQNVHINNVNIDWKRPMISQGKIVEACEEYVDIEIATEYPYEVSNNTLYFIGEGWKESIWALMEIDKRTMAPAYDSGDNCLGIEGSYRNLYVEELKQGLIRIKGKFHRVLEFDNYVIMRHGKRVNPGIFIQECRDVNLEEINIYHAGGMGVIAQKSENITLKETNVKIRKGSNRVFTAFADATHFVNCKGLIHIENCLFENQLDDATNVHGIYVKIKKLINNDTILVKLMHPQHKGVVVLKEDDEIGFIKTDSLLTYEKSKVKEVRKINKDYMLITLSHDLPDNIEENDCIENLTWNADLLIKNCIVRANRARGLLISTPGKVIIEKNMISVPGAAIKISGDANSWYESGAVKNVLIRNNHFLDCNYCYGPWGKSVIDIDPEIEKLKENEESYHKNIKIEHNIFETFSNGIINGYSTQNLYFKNNVLNKTTTYPANDNTSPVIRVKAVKNIMK